MPLLGDDGTDATAMTWRSTRYREADGSPEGVYDTARGQVRRTYHTSWAGRDQAALDFAGTAVVQYDGSTGAGYIARTLPHRLPSKPFMRVSSVLSVKPVAIRGTDGIVGDGTGIAKYEMAEIVLQYQFHTYRFREDNEIWGPTGGDLEGRPDEGHALSTGFANSRYISKTTQFSTRELVTNRGLMRKPSGKPILEGIPLREATGAVVYTHHMVPEDGVPQIVHIELGASVNDAEFDGWPAGTLLLNSMPEIRPEPNVIDGQRYVTCQYRFNLLMLFDQTQAIRTIRGHNYIRQLQNGVFVPVLMQTDKGGAVEESAVGNEKLAFPRQDFRRLFRPDPAF